MKSPSQILKRGQIAEKILLESEAMVKLIGSSDNVQVLESQIYEISNTRKPNEKISVRLKVIRIVKVHSDIQVVKKVLHESQN